MLTDPIGAFRRTLPDGTVVDLSSYDEEGVIVVFVREPNGTIVFIDFDVPVTRTQPVETDSFWVVTTWTGVSIEPFIFDGTS